MVGLTSEFKTFSPPLIFRPTIAMKVGLHACDRYRSAQILKNQLDHSLPQSSLPVDPPRVWHLWHLMEERPFPVLLLRWDVSSPIAAGFWCGVLVSGVQNDAAFVNDFFQDSVFGAFWALVLLLPRHSACQADAEATSNPGRWGAGAASGILSCFCRNCILVWGYKCRKRMSRRARFVLACLLYSLVLSALPLSGTIIRTFLNTAYTDAHRRGQMSPSGQNIEPFMFF